MIPQTLLTPYGAGHLGDTLCISTLPRQLFEEFGQTVQLSRSMANLAVFKNNPFVKSFSESKGYLTATGNGHLIQRHQRGFGVSVDVLPKPEIYLADEEVQWAREQKRSWPTDGKPVCVYSCRAITDAGDLNKVNWKSIGAQLLKHCLVIQPLLSTPGFYIQQVSNIQLNERNWRAEPEIPSAVIYRNLTTRQYMALFSVADVFCGGTSGGSHLAAAFDIPALIVAPGLLSKRLRFPDSNPLITNSAFLYPQHHFVSADDLLSPNALQIEQAIRRVVAEACDAPTRKRWLEIVMKSAVKEGSKRQTPVWFNHRLRLVPTL